MEVLPEQHGGLFVGDEQSVTGINRPFPAKLTAYDGSRYYAWVEQQPFTGGPYSDLDGGRTGTVTTDPAYEANNFPAQIGGIYLLYRSYYDAVLGWVYAFWTGQTRPTTTTTLPPCTGVGNWTWSDGSQLWTLASDNCSTGCVPDNPQFCGHDAGTLCQTDGTSVAVTRCVHPDEVHVSPACAGGTVGPTTTTTTTTRPPACGGPCPYICYGPPVNDWVLCAGALPYCTVTYFLFGTFGPYEIIVPADPSGTCQCCPPAGPCTPGDLVISSCYGPGQGCNTTTTTTSTTSTTTTTHPPCGNCLFQGNGSGGWNWVGNSCVDPCTACPPPSGSSVGAGYVQTGCDTTTTSTTTTTTTCSPTPPTAGPCPCGCPCIYCYGSDGQGNFGWQPASAGAEGFCPYGCECEGPPSFDPVCLIHSGGGSCYDVGCHTVSTTTSTTCGPAWYCIDTGGGPACQNITTCGDATGALSGPFGNGGNCVAGGCPPTTTTTCAPGWAGPGWYCAGSGGGSPSCLNFAACDPAFTYDAGPYTTEAGCTSDTNACNP